MSLSIGSGPEHLIPATVPQNEAPEYADLEELIAEGRNRSDESPEDTTPSTEAIPQPATDGPESMAREAPYDTGNQLLGRPPTFEDLTLTHFEKRSPTTGNNAPIIIPLAGTSHSDP